MPRLSPPPGCSSRVRSCWSMGTPADHPERPDDGGAVVAVEIGAVEVGHAAAAIDVAPGHGAAVGVGVFHHGRDVPRHRAGGAAARRVRAEGSLVEVPAVILPADARRRLVVNLLDLPLADVTDVEIAGRLVEREAPGVAQPVGPDLVEARDGGIRVVGRDGVRRRVDVDPQQLAQERREALAVAVGVAERAPRLRDRRTGSRRWGRTRACRRCGLLAPGCGIVSTFCRLAGSATSGSAETVKRSIKLF